MALQPFGQVVATIRLEVNSDTVGPAASLGRLLGSGQWAVEGAAGLGRGVAQGLARAGEPVLDVPSQLAARTRLLNTGHARKTDAIDAAAVAMVAQHHRRLHPVRAEDDSVVLRLLSQRRDDLAGSAPGRRTACTRCCATSFPAAPSATSPPTRPRRCCTRSTR